MKGEGDLDVDGKLQLIAITKINRCTALVISAASFNRQVAMEVCFLTCRSEGAATVVKLVIFLGACVTAKMRILYKTTNCS